MDRYIARLKEEEVPIREFLVWDEEREVCGGFLSKKASKSSSFSKGKLQKRWVWINSKPDPDGNYFIEYFHTPEEFEKGQPARQSFSLVRASVKLSTGNSFVVSFHDDSAITLSAENATLMRQWVETIENVLKVADRREKVLVEMETAEAAAADAHTESDQMSDSQHSGTDSRSHKRSPKPKRSLSEKQKAQPEQRNKYVFFRPPTKLYPTLRLDIDASTIPPSTTARHEFTELFRIDIAKVLDITPEMVEVISIKPAPSLGWLINVEMDLDIVLPPVNADEMDSGSSADSYLDSLSYEKEEMKMKLFQHLHELVKNPQSALYSGFITSRLDPSFSQNMVEKRSNDVYAADGTGTGTGSDEGPVSSDPEVLRIMNKYYDIEVPPSFLDISHFNILVAFENRQQTISIPNPVVIRKRCCGLWPFEVMEALGFMNTMQELWLTPIALIPKDMPLALKQRVEFEESVRMGGEMFIHAAHLKADLVYEVEFEDRREDALNSLSDDEMYAIQETFQEYDINGDGGISIAEMTELVRARTLERKKTIQDKFDAFVNDEGVLEDEVHSAENSKAQYFQQLNESQNKLVGMFDAADTNGDGVISFTEFIMAEAWWLRCTLNPDTCHLF